MPVSRRVLLVLLITAVAAGGALWFKRQGEGDKKTPGKPGPVPVTVALVEAGDVPLLLNTMGRAEAMEGVTLKARVDGQVKEVVYADGQAVKRGDVLVRLDPSDFQAKVAQAEAVVARDEAQLAKARADVERYTGLRAQGFVSQEKLNEVRTNEAAYVATMKADQAVLELARLQLSYTTIRAPFSGVVGARIVFPGSAVKINDTALAVVNRLDPLYVTFSVPERHLARLRDSLRAGAMPVDVSLPGSKEPGFVGKARFIDNAVDQATGTIIMKAVVDNPKGLLTPGQFLQVSTTLSRLEQAALVPNEAVQQGAEGQFVYVMKADETAEMRKVEVLTSYQGKSAIGKGVSVGEQVVTDGHLRLVPGASVKPKGAGKAPQNSGTPAVKSETPAAAR